MNTFNYSLHDVHVFFRCDKSQGAAGQLQQRAGGREPHPRRARHREACESRTCLQHLYSTTTCLTPTAICRTSSMLQARRATSMSRLRTLPRRHVAVEMYVTRCVAFKPRSLGGGASPSARWAWCPRSGAWPTSASPSRWPSVIIVIITVYC